MKKWPAFYIVVIPVLGTFAFIVAYLAWGAGHGPVPWPEWPVFVAVVGIFLLVLMVPIQWLAGVLARGWVAFAFSGSVAPALLLARAIHCQSWASELAHGIRREWSTDWGLYLTILALTLTFTMAHRYWQRRVTLRP